MKGYPRKSNSQEMGKIYSLVHTFCAQLISCHKKCCMFWPFEIKSADFQRFCGLKYSLSGCSIREHREISSLKMPNVKAQ